jgi:hypothetical protein
MSTMWPRQVFQQQRRSAQRLVAGLAVVLACASGVAVGAATVAPVARAAGTPDEIAQATLDHIVDGDFVAAAAPFDPTLQKKFPANALGEAWGAYQQLLGQYQSHGDPEDTQRDPLTVVDIPVVMAKQPGQFRVKVHPDGTVAGIYFLKEGVPVP